MSGWRRNYYTDVGRFEWVKVVAESIDGTPVTITQRLPHDPRYDMVWAIEYSNYAARAEPPVAIRRANNRVSALLDFTYAHTRTSMKGQSHDTDDSS